MLAIHLYKPKKVLYKLPTTQQPVKPCLPLPYFLCFAFSNVAAICYLWVGHGSILFQTLKGGKIQLLVSARQLPRLQKDLG